MRFFTGRRLITVAALATALTGIGAGAAVAAITFKSGTSVTRVTVLTQDTAATYSSTGWTTVASSSVFAGANSIVLARFTAESACYGTAGWWCSIRILIDGVQADPAVGTDFAFDFVQTASSWESHSVERVRTVTFTGTHSVVVQAAQPVAGITNRLDDYTLSSWAIAP